MTAKTINDGYLAAVKSLFQASLLDDPPHIVAKLEAKWLARSR